MTAYGANAYNWPGISVQPTAAVTPSATSVYTVVGVYTSGCSSQKNYFGGR